ncbi:MAG: hypothetical protein PHQ05_05045 [Sterolibacterium sp.]|nr:hypothetical protein [Sterolibacterium sp.]
MNTETSAVAMDEDETPSPEFAHAAMEYGIYVDAGLTHLPTARAAMARMLEYAPPSLQRRLHVKAQSLGLIPAPTGYLDDGTAVYALDNLAAHLGMSPDEVKASLGGAQETGENHPAALSRAAIHTVQ